VLTRLRQPVNGIPVGGSIDCSIAALGCSNKSFARDASGKSTMDWAACCAWRLCDPRPHRYVSRRWPGLSRDLLASETSCSVYGTASSPNHPLLSWQENGTKSIHVSAMRSLGCRENYTYPVLSQICVLNRGKM
jgi:hypothetical protein